MPNLLQVETPHEFPSEASQNRFYSSHKLCENCQRIFLETPLHEPGHEAKGKHCETLHALEISASEGCQICLMISSTRDREQYREYGPTEASPHLTWRVEGEGRLADVPSQPLRRLYVEHGNFVRTLAIHNPKSPEEYDIAKPIDSCSTGSDVSLGAAARWLSECLAAHAKCSERSVESTWLPTRLVDIGSPNTSPPQPLRLMLGEDVEPGTKYLTLSHRWTTEADMPKLDQSSLVEFRHSIPPAVLGKDYLDVVQVVRFLGYRYIWIDSLCIIQDSREDWRRECSQMGKVYRNTACNISMDAVTSLFSSRNPKSRELIAVRSVREGEQDHQWAVSQHFPTQETLIDRDYSAPLLRRGWVMQEWFMSPRILHFGHGLITWECCEGSASEAYPAFKPGRAVLTFNRKSEYEEERLQSVQDCLMAWWHVVVTYSNTDVTVPGDKLPAVSAVAKEIVGHLRRVAPLQESIEYLAGLWSTCFVQQLIWISNVESTARRPVEYRAPSWSWVSLDSTIAPARPKDVLEKKIVAEVLERTVIPRGEDPFQEVIGGHIKMRCWLWKIRPSCQLGLFQSTDGVQIRYDVAGEGVKPGCINEGEAYIQGEVYLMPVIVRAKGFAQTLEAGTPGGLAPHVAIHGLVLSRDEAANGRFTRAGTFLIEVRAKAIIPTIAEEEGLEERRAVTDQIDALALDDFLEPLLRHVGQKLDCHRLETDLHPTAYETRTEDARFRANDAPRCARSLYTITMI
ncbi:hypothetical protein SLS58_007957 [Diplodia intermedia]|uniref:Heterokaryon incompatibility domain-containing protein n=1 Tax=Diplodia intermedia TaxID=856260 RepID=A0ABR3TIN1_9PEZI